ncbi:MAG: hypothetical protein LBQ93_01325 [Treponema sp.]|jgi:hypothetical protein|nr:hypothetical protein [Treponema sp.]
MAVWSLIKRQDFGFGDRFDPEFYQSSFRKIRNRLCNARLLGSCLVDIRYGLQAEPEYVDHGIEYIRAMNLNAPWIAGDILQITQNQMINEEYRLKEGDILITRSGANCGSVSLITNRFAGATFGSYTIRLRTNSETDPFTLFAFLLTNAGRALTMQARYGSAQPNLSIPYLKNLILVPKFSKTLTSQVQSKVLDAINTAHSETLFYTEAETELLERIGWETLRKKRNKLSYIVSFNKLIESNRTDAEFFQSQYAYLQKHLKQLNADSIDSIVTYCVRGVQPLYTESGSVRVVNSKHLGATQIDFDNLETTTAEFFNRRDIEYAQLRKNDVLVYATGAYIGRTNIYLSDEAAIASNHVTILRVNRGICNPVYLALFLNSPAGMIQAAQYATGSAQRELYPHHIRQFLVFIPRNKNGSIDLEWQKRLAAKVKASIVAKEKAQQQLEEAKRLVEEALKQARNKF